MTPLRLPARLVLALSVLLASQSQKTAAAVHLKRSGNGSLDSSDDEERTIGDPLLVSVKTRKANEEKTEVFLKWVDAETLPSLKENEKYGFLAAVALYF